MCHVGYGATSGLGGTCSNTLKHVRTLYALYRWVHPSCWITLNSPIAEMFHDFCPCPMMSDGEIRVKSIEILPGPKRAPLPLHWRGQGLRPSTGRPMDSPNQRGNLGFQGFTSQFQWKKSERLKPSWRGWSQSRTGAWHIIAQEKRVPKWL